MRKVDFESALGQFRFVGETEKNNQNHCLCRHRCPHHPLPITPTPVRCNRRGIGYTKLSIRRPSVTTTTIELDDAAAPVVANDNDIADNDTVATALALLVSELIQLLVISR
jgi:hypothetical protein